MSPESGPDRAPEGQNPSVDGAKPPLTRPDGPTHNRSTACCTPSGLTLDGLREILVDWEARGPIVTRLEASAPVDHALRRLPRAQHALQLDAGLLGVPWTIALNLGPRQIRAHYSDGTSRVIDL